MESRNTSQDITKEMAILRAEALNRDLEDALQETMAKNRYIKLLTNVATAANKSKDIDDAIHTAIKEICYYTDWALGHCHIYNHKSQALEPTKLWYMKDESLFGPFREQTESHIDCGWIASVYQSGKPSWIMSSYDNALFHRMKSAEQCGIRAGFAFPIFLDDCVFGVMEFFSQSEQTLDESLLDVMADIGLQLGHVVQRKEFEHKARLYEAVVVNANDGIMITRTDINNHEGPEITFVNNALCNITGYQPEEIIGKTPKLLQGEKTDRETLEQLKQSISRGEPFKGELINYSKSGQEYWLDVSIVPIRNRDQEITHFAAIERDISEEKRFVQDLMLAKDQAESANKSKSDFLANMSHELRTPMNGIMGMAGLLMDTELDTEQMELMRTILSSSENLLSILNDILDLSKIEAGMVEVDEVPYDIRHALHETTKIYTAIVMEKDLEPIKVEISKDIPLCLLGDLNKIQQILRNLLSNALKFTQAGGIRIVVDIESDHLLFKVIDSGIGIPEDRRIRIFEKFTQADESTTRNFGGTGLGLAICKEFTELLGGTIGVESEVGAGSTFWFKVPYQPVHSKIAPVNQKIELLDDDDSKFLSANILVVDDHPINRLFAQKLLRKLGYQNLFFAEDGAQALAEFSHQNFDLILMDCQMPVLDGYTTTVEIREIEGNQQDFSRTPIVAMTANAMIGDREKCLDAGMDDYISKPIKPDILRNKLYELLSKNAEGNLGCDITFFYDGNTEITAKNTKKDLLETTQETSLPKPMALDISRLDLFCDTMEEKRELITLFIEQASQNINSLQEALALNDTDSWKSYAHRLKGSSANFGADGLSEIAANAEKVIEDDTVTKEALYQQVVSSFAIVRNELAHYMEG